VSTRASLQPNLLRNDRRRQAGARTADLPPEDLLQLVHLYAERGSPKYERAALRWLQRYLNEGSPRLQHFAKVTTELARRERDPP